MSFISRALCLRKEELGTYFDGAELEDIVIVSDERKET